MLLMNGSTMSGGRNTYGTYLPCSYPIGLHWQNSSSKIKQEFWDSNSKALKQTWHLFDHGALCNHRGCKSMADSECGCFFHSPQCDVVWMSTFNFVRKCQNILQSTYTFMGIVQQEFCLLWNLAYTFIGIVRVFIPDHDNRCVIVVNCSFNLHFLKTVDTLSIVLIFHVSVLFYKVSLSFVIYLYHLYPYSWVWRVLYIKSHNSQPHQHLNKLKG